MPAAWETARGTAVGGGCVPPQGDTCAPGAHGALTNNLGSQRSQGPHALFPVCRGRDRTNVLQFPYQTWTQVHGKNEKLFIFLGVRMAADPAGAQCSPSRGRDKTWKPFEALPSLGRGSRRESLGSRGMSELGLGSGWKDRLFPGGSPSFLRGKSISIPTPRDCASRMCQM